MKLRLKITEILDSIRLRIHKKEKSNELFN